MRNRFLYITLSGILIFISCVFCCYTNCTENIKQSENIKLETYSSSPHIIEVYILENSVESEQINIMEQRVRQELQDIEYIEDRQEWFLAYKDIVSRYAEWFGVPQTVSDVYTEEEIIIICRAIETECYDQDFLSKCDVASVILNRIDYGGEFGNSVKEIITKEGQFAYGREDITESTILSLMYAYEIEDTTDGCIAFRSDKRPEIWYGWTYSFTDEAGHHFYK
ncbi:MAG: cell wall hydrolase [Clostridium sp.]|nr:cell wall hydrolase [Ruminococcus flavefaciens]MCM1500672.1 cell wall hydrolase [Clostridium sp.]